MDIMGSVCVNKQTPFIHGFSLGYNKKKSKGIYVCEKDCYQEQLERGKKRSINSNILEL